MTGLGKASLAISAGLFALAVVAAQAQTAPAAPAVKPAPAAADPAMKAKVENACSACHVFTQVSAQNKTPDQWAATVDQMIALGATVSDEDYPKVVAYLAATYPAGAKPTGR